MTRAYPFRRKVDYRVVRLETEAKAKALLSSYVFAQSIMSAGDTYLSNPMETPFMPSWNRVSSAIPGVLDKLLEAVEKDNT